MNDRALHATPLPATPTIARTPGSWQVTAATGRVLAYTYGRNDGGAGSVSLTLDEAPRIAAGIARLPEVLRRGDGEAICCRGIWD